jgi:hypothetical protein
MDIMIDQNKKGGRNEQEHWAPQTMTQWFSKKLDLTSIESQIVSSTAMVVLVGMLLLITSFWDNKIYAFFLAMAFCGAVTSLVSVGALLREEHLKENFFVSIPFDMSTASLPLVHPEFTSDAEHVILLSRVAELSGIANRLGPVWNINNPPKGTKTDMAIHLDTEIARYCGELMQYHIFRVLHKLHDNLWFSSQLAVRAGEEVTHPFATLKMTEYQGGHLLKFVSTNRFAQPPSEQLFWSQSRLCLPEYTRVTLGEMVPSPGVAYGGHKVRLAKPGFFEIGFSVGLIGTSRRGVLPLGLNFPEEEKAHLRTFQYAAQMSVHFSRITAGNRQTKDLKRWARLLMRTVREAISDGALPEAEPGDQTPPFSPPEGTPAPE